MKKIVNLIFMLSLIIFTSCERSTATWENVKTAGRYFQKGIDSLCGKENESYLVRNESDFIGPDSQDFIPLDEKDLKSDFISSEKAVSQPKHSFGEGGIPGFANFHSPTSSSSIFKTIHFKTDDHVIREKDDLVTIQKIADYMKKHPNLILCVEGHCDERASAAYNLALGTRRANQIRVLLIKNGVDFNKIYTISYGKEKPVALGHNAQDWSLNRRGDFKIYEK